MTPELVIIGAGGLGREVAWMVHQINQHTPTWDLIGFYDDQIAPGTVVNGLPVLGAIADLAAKSKSCSVVLAIGNPETRKGIYDRIKHQSFHYPVIVHPRADLGELAYNSIGEGSIICAGTTITTNIFIGNFCLVNLHCTIGHDVHIEDFVSLMPDVNLSGHVKVEERVLVGAGSVILPQIVIGAGSKIGAGAVVTKPVPPNVTAIGVPAKVKSL